MRRYDANYFKNSLLVKIIIIGGIIWFVSNLFGNKQNNGIIMNKNIETETNEYIDNKYSGELSDEETFNKMQAQLSADALIHSPSFTKYISSLKNKMENIQFLLDSIDTYIESHPNDRVAYVMYGLADIKGGYKAIGYIDKAIELGGGDYAVSYITRGVLFGELGKYNEENKDFLKAKSLDYPLKYRFLYEKFGLMQPTE